MDPMPLTILLTKQPHRWNLRELMDLRPSLSHCFLPPRVSCEGGGPVWEGWWARRWLGTRADDTTQHRGEWRPGAGVAAEVQTNGTSSSALGQMAAAQYKGGRGCPVQEG